MSAPRPPEALLSCAGCGATVYPEHMERHQAGYWGGALYCPCCLQEKKDGKPASPPPAEPPLTLEEAPPAPPPAAPSSTPVGGPSSGITVPRHPPRPGAQGATRMRIFHSRLSDGAIAHLDQQINEWLDRHPDIEIKFAETTVGVWEGKHPEPNLIMSVFY